MRFVALALGFTISHFAALVAAALFVVGMAFSGEGIRAVKDRTRYDLRRSPGVAESLRALFKHLEGLGNPDLQFVAYDTSGAADIVINAGGCKLFAWFMHKPASSTVDAWLKGSDHATVAAADGDVVTKLVGTSGGNREYCPIWADGLPLPTGLTIASHTTVNGATDSAAADSPSGFCIIGAAL